MIILKKEREDISIYENSKKVGVLQHLYGLEFDKEYNLSLKKDFRFTSTRTKFYNRNKKLKEFQVDEMYSKEKYLLKFNKMMLLINFGVINRRE